MEFGRPEQDILLIDHRLPPDGTLTEKVLSSIDNAGTKFYVGCAKWGRREWVGPLYPEKTRDVDFLLEYAKRFDTIELGATFYTRPDRDQQPDQKND